MFSVYFIPLYRFFFFSKFIIVFVLEMYMFKSDKMKVLIAFAISFKILIVSVFAINGGSIVSVADRGNGSFCYTVPVMCWHGNSTKGNSFIPDQSRLICNGAIVSERRVLTTKACIVNVKIIKPNKKLNSNCTKHLSCLYLTIWMWFTIILAYMEQMMKVIS